MSLVVAALVVVAAVVRSHAPEPLSPRSYAVGKMAAAAVGNFDAAGVLTQDASPRSHAGERWKPQPPLAWLHDAERVARPRAIGRGVEPHWGGLVPPPRRSQLCRWLI